MKDYARRKGYDPYVSFGGQDTIEGTRHKEQGTGKAQGGKADEQTE
jgi:hypothetical protein